MTLRYSTRLTISFTRGKMRVLVRHLGQHHVEKTSYTAKGDGLERTLSKWQRQQQCWPVMDCGTGVIE